MAPARDAAGEVEAGIHCIRCVYGGIKPLAVYVLSGRITVWVDVGITTTPTAHVIPYLETSASDAWRRPQWALITHADMDHYGGLRELAARRPELAVLAHARDQRWIESPDAILRERFLLHESDGISPGPERRKILLERGGGGGRVDLTLNGGETLHLGDGGSWTVLHCPGHTDGHLVLWNAARRFAVIGDAALGWGVPDVHGALMAPPPYFALDAYRRTVRQLQALEPERVFTSHYGILDRAAARAFFDDSLSAIAAIESTLADALRRHSDGLSLRELCRAVGHASPHWPEPMWAGLADPISAHLADAIAAGRVEMTGQRRYRAT